MHTHAEHHSTPEWQLNLPLPHKWPFAAPLLQPQATRQPLLPPPPFLPPGPSPLHQRQYPIRASHMLPARNQTPFPASGSDAAPPVQPLHPYCMNGTLAEAPVAPFDVSAQVKATPLSKSVPPLHAPKVHPVLICPTPYPNPRHRPHSLSPATERPASFCPAEAFSKAHAYPDKSSPEATTQAAADTLTQTAALQPEQADVMSSACRASTVTERPATSEGTQLPVIPLQMHWKTCPFQAWVSLLLCQPNSQQHPKCQKLQLQSR